MTKEVEAGVRVAMDHSHHVRHVRLLSKLLDLETPVLTDTMMDYLLQVRPICVCVGVLLLLGSGAVWYTRE